MTQSAIERLMHEPPFTLDAAVKAERFREAMAEAVRHHFANNELFRRQAQRSGFDPNEPLKDLSRVPFLPMAIFKRLWLLSVPEAEIVRTLQSSATTGSQPSRIALDHVTRQRQAQALVAVLTHVLGPERRPFLVIDADPVSAATGSTLPARQAALRGFLIAASDTAYALRPAAQGSLEADEDQIESVLSGWQSSGTSGCIFGFTFLLYQYLLERLEAKKRTFRLGDLAVLHIGGWKKLTQQKISKPELNRRLAQTLGMSERHIIDLYGFTEQMGVVYPDCAEGWKHVPVFAEVFARDPRTLGLVPDGTDGLLQFLTPIPHSYPGISVLTDDLGRVRAGRCGCGTAGTAFQVTGRASDHEVRGCGDVLAEELQAGGGSRP